MESHAERVTVDNLTDWQVCKLIEKALEGHVNSYLILKMWSAFGPYEGSHEERSKGVV